MILLRRSIAVVLCSVLSGVPAVFAAPADAPAGRIQALVPSATVNQKAAVAKGDLAAHDLLQTGQSGRMRAGLNDGTILSLGSSSEMRVTQHDSASQQTVLELGLGKLRSKVVRITQPGGKFEVRTPNAVVGVVGTDFYVSYENSVTTVICYRGVVTVSALAGAAANSASSVRLNAGEKTTVSSQAPPAAGVASAAAELTASMGDTDVSGGAAGGTSASAHAGHTGTYILLGILAVAGVAIGIFSNKSGKTTSGNPNGRKP